MPLRLLALALLLLVGGVAEAAGIDAVRVETGDDGEQTYTLSMQILLLMTALTLLPALLLSMTAFTRIIIVLGLLRQALGTGQTPSNQILLGLALLLTMFVMSPVAARPGPTVRSPTWTATWRWSRPGRRPRRRSAASCCARRASPT